MSTRKNQVCRSALGEALHQGLDALPGSRRFSGPQLEIIYGLAYAHVVQRQYAKALPVFAFLSQYGPTYKHYWAGLALCLHMTGRHDEAASIYNLNAMLFPESPDSTLHLAECQLAGGHAPEARETLTLVLRKVEEGSFHPELAARAQALLHLAQAPLAA